MEIPVQVFINTARGKRSTDKNTGISDDNDKEAKGEKSHTLGNGITCVELQEKTKSTKRQHSSYHYFNTSGSNSSSDNKINDNNNGGTYNNNRNGNDSFQEKTTFVFSMITAIGTSLITDFLYEKVRDHKNVTVQIGEHQIQLKKRSEFKLAVDNALKEFCKKRATCKTTSSANNTAHKMQQY